MRWKLFVEFCVTISATCILAGDLFLPHPYNSGSEQLRSSINSFLIDLLPSKAIIDVNFQNRLTEFT